MGIPEWNWLIDYASPYHGYMYGVKQHIYSGSTAFQRVDIVDTYAFGRCLVLDGKIQSSELDEYVYHEILVHPAILIHPTLPKEALIMGGGEGAVLRELLKYPSIESIVMVDLDKEVVDICRENLPAWHENSFSDKRVELLHMDARQYLEENDRCFDVIISDLTEPVDEGPSYLLFTREFYNILIKRLNPGGALSLQSGSLSLPLLSSHAAVKNTLECCFNFVHTYHTFIPSFDSSWGFILASQDRDPGEVVPAEVDKHLEKNGLELKYYDGETHLSMFSIPKNIRRALEEEHRIIEDDNPVIIY